jgi:4-amino-4-deoxy-L-arabinose transferase-like glycosyltransferase
MPPFRTTVLGFLVVVAVAFLLRWPIADIPLERDEGEYGYVAQRWLAGEPPYRSAFDQKPPGVFAAYAVILSVFGTTPAAIHWAAQVYTLATLGLLYLTARRLFGSATGFAAALLAAYMTLDRCVLGNAANTELFMILPLTAGLLAAVRSAEDSSLAWAAVAGACGMAALMFKQVALPNVAFHGLLLLAAQRRKALLLLAYALAAAAVLAAVVGYFAAVGALRDFTDCVIRHNLAYAQQVPLAQYPAFFVATFSVIAFQWWPLMLLAVEGYRWADATERPRVRLTVIWLAMSLVGVVVGGYFREHYYIQAIPPLAILAGRGAVHVGRRWSPNRPALPVFLALGAIAYGVLVMPKYYLADNPAEKSRLLYADAPFPESIPVGEYLARTAGLDDTIFVYGSEPQIYFYANRRAACRYIYVYPLLTPAPGVLERQQTALDEITANRPRFIVVHRDVFPFYFGERPPPLRLSEELQKLLARDYQIVAVAGPGDTAVRKFNGVVAQDETMNPPVPHTLAVWRRRDS